MKMVRKRAPAQKALSPTKEILTTANQDHEHDHQLNNQFNKSSSRNGIGGHMADEGLTSSSDMELSFSDDLPGFDAFSKELSERSKGYWNCLQQDYNDFTSWTCLLQAITENENNLPAAEAVFRCFLRYYPYCYGYWKKFADLEKRNGKLDRAQQVFQHGIKAIPISIDLWVHYLNFAISNKELFNGETGIRSLFNSAISSAGMEFKSNKLWEAFIQWERALGNYRKVTEIYDRLINAPNQQYIKNWQKFKEHLETHSPADVLSTEEYMKTMHELDIVPPGMSSEEDVSVVSAIPALDIVNKDSNSHGPDNSELSEREKILQKNADLIRKKVIATRETIFMQTATEIKKRWKFEDAIKRPYFHVKPLEKCQLKNWKEYLDFEINEGNDQQITFLFERCVVVCALYEEFWQKYLDYIEEKDAGLTRSVYSRACGTHLLKKFEMHIKWAIFEEKQNKYENAATVLSNLDRNFPGIILVTQHRIGLARRMKRFDEIESIYENAIKCADRIEDKIFFSIKFSHVLAKFCGDKSKARLVLLDALKLGKKQKRLYLQLLDLEMHYGSVEDEHILSLFNSVKNDLSLSDEVRHLFAQRKVEFYEEYGNDIQSVIEVRDNFETQYKLISSKRKLSESTQPSGSQKSKKKEKTKTEDSSAQLPLQGIPLPESFPAFTPGSQAAYNTDSQSFYNWDQQFQQYQNFPPQS